MGLFDVYVEGATDPSPVALQRLAEVMSQRYGLPAAELQARLTKGRFRVKANVDDATAQTYVRDLEAVGARVTLAEARGGSTLPPPESRPPPHPITVSPRQRNESRGSYSISRNGNPLPDDELLPARPSPTPPSITPRTLSDNSVASPQRTSSPSLPPQPSPLPPRSSPALPPHAAGASHPPATAPFASGLSAAFGESGPVDAAAFDGLSVGSVGSLDDNAPQVETSPVLPASIGPTAIKPALPKVDKPKDVPMDLFAPPESQGDEFKVELAAEEVAHRERKRTPAAVPIVVPPSPSSPVLRPKGPQAERSAGVRMPSMSDEAPRGRFAAGVIVAVVLGFIPATLVQSCREEAAFDKIDTHVAAVQQQASTDSAAPIPFAKLDEFRDEQIAKKKSERRNIAIVSMLIWALGGAGIGYVWFRRVPWDKLKFS